MTWSYRYVFETRESTRWGICQDWFTWRDLLCYFWPRVFTSWSYVIDPNFHYFLYTPLPIYDWLDLILFESLNVINIIKKIKLNFQIFNCFHFILQKPSITEYFCLDSACSIRIRINPIGDGLDKILVIFVQILIRWSRSNQNILLP